MKLFPVLFFLLTIHISSAQDNKTAAFISLFQEIEFEGKHVYSFSRKPSDFPSTSTYPYKGILIDSSFHSLFTEIDPEDLDPPAFYATYRFFVNYNIEALLVRESQIQGTEHHIHFLVFNHEKNKVTSSLTLSYQYGYEGGFGGMESWIMDVDNNGIKDVVSRMWSELQFTDYEGEFVQTHHDSVTISIFDGTKFQEIGVKDTLLQKGIEADFPYYEEPYFKYNIEEHLFDYLKEEIDFEKPERSDYSWNVIAGSDKDLPAAQHEIKRAEEIIGFNYKYGLDARLFQTYENNGRFYTIIQFRTKAAAEIALREIQKVFNATAYIVHEKEWCPEAEYQTGWYYRCKD